MPLAFHGMLDPVRQIGPGVTTGLTAICCAEGAPLMARGTMSPMRLSASAVDVLKVPNQPGLALKRLGTMVTLQPHFYEFLPFSLDNCRCAYIHYVY